VSGHRLGKHSLGVLPPPDATYPRPWPPNVIARLSEAYAEIQAHNPYDDPCLVRALGIIGALREQFGSLDQAELDATAEAQLQRYQAEREGA
jgi:hypothetical protein